MTDEELLMVGWGWRSASYSVKFKNRDNSNSGVDASKLSTPERMRPSETSF